MKFLLRVLFRGILPAVLILLVVEFGIRILYPGLMKENIPLTFQSRKSVSINSVPQYPEFQLFGSRAQVIRRDKTDPDQIRIFILGSSAVYGDGVPYFMSFPAVLERILQFVYPDHPVEVINGGTGGEDSTYIVGLADRVAKELSPDIIIVMTGNNEFIRMVVCRRIYPWYSGHIEEIRSGLNKLAIYRLIRKHFSRPEEEFDIMRYYNKEEDLWDKDYIGEAEAGVVRKLYRENMEKIACSSKHTGTKLLLCTVPINLKYYSLRYTWDNFDLTSSYYIKKPKLYNALKEAGNLYKQGDTYKAAAVLERYLARDRNGMAAFVLAHLKLKLGEEEAASELFKLAAELDTNPCKALPSFAGIVRETGKKFDVPVADLMEMIESRHPERIPGNEFFWDPCHFTQKGHRLAACEIVESLMKNKLLPSTKRDFKEAIKSSDTYFSNTYDIRGWKGFKEYVSGNRKEALVFFPQMAELSWPDTPIGFDSAVNYKINMIKKHIPLSDSSPLRQAIAGHELFLLHRYGEAVERYRIAIKLAPDQHRLLVSLGESLLFLQDLKGAALAFKEYYKKEPGDPEMKLRKTQFDF